MDVENLIKTVRIGIAEEDPMIIGILVAVVVVLLTLVVLIIRGGSSKKRGVLLVGICDAGKTLMFTQLVNRCFKKTHTSIKENTGSYQLSQGKSGTLKVVDVPGYERLRYAVVEQYRNSARGLIYVIDSMTFQKEVKDVAEFLYSLLTDDVLARSLSYVLIACSKQDQNLSKGAKVIQNLLEKEMNTLRVTQAATLEGTDNKSSAKFLGKKNKNFLFSDLKPMKIEFVECSSAPGSRNGDNSPDLVAVEEWLHKIA